MSFTALKVGASAEYGSVTPDGELRLFNPEGEKVKGEMRLHGGGPWPVEFKTSGWGGEASEDEGEWGLTNWTEGPTAKAGTLGAVIGVAEGLGTKGAVVSGGSMTVEGNPAVAEVTLETGGATRHFTLTKLAWQGDERVAQVHDEGAGSPPVGHFDGTGGQGTLKGSLISGHSRYLVEFKLKG